MMANYRFLVVLGALLIYMSFAHAATAEDAYIAGYAAGALKHELKLDMPALVVKDGVITLPTANPTSAERAEATKVLSEIPEVLVRLK